MKFALKLGALAFVVLVYVVASLFALSAWEVSTARSSWFFAFAEAHSDALADERTQASVEGRDPSTVWTACGYPPRVPVTQTSPGVGTGVFVSVSSEELLASARCLNRRGYLSTEVLRDIEQGDDGSAGIVNRHRTLTFVGWLAGLLGVFGLAAFVMFRRRPQGST